MVISRTPYRVSFFGGGTDYPAWFRENGGAVLTTSIDKYCYISCRHLPPFFEHKHRIVYSKAETVKEISEIQHPSARAVLNYMKIESGLEIHHDGDLPARSGLGSSSSFTVGLINALKALRGEIISKKHLAEIAIYIEQKVIEENVGSQDQIIASFGGFNRIDFNHNGTFGVSPLIVHPSLKKYLEEHLLLFFTGLSRNAPEIAKHKIENFCRREKELKAMREMVDEATEILRGPVTALGDFGTLLHESWKLKRSLSDRVSNGKIDEIYEAGLSAGATGGKLLGAGGGGFMLFFVSPDKRAALVERLKPLIPVNFRFESEGSKIVVYEPTLDQYRQTGAPIDFPAPIN